MIDTSTVAAISTAKGMGGIGVIRISGEKAIEIANKIFVPFNKTCNILSMKGYTAKYGKVVKDGKTIDEAILLIFRAPHSYTGENVAEISCHGGLFSTREVLRAVLESGAVLAPPGEFTKRAFLNGKLDLSQAESVMNIISAKSKRASLIAVNQKDGSLSKKVGDIKERLLNISATLSVWADFPEDDILQLDIKKVKGELEFIKSKLDFMIDSYDRVLNEGVKTVIIGQTNVGKSTLMNLISGYEKSIVTDIAGTTRDVIEETVMVGDIPLILTDTAGIRQTDDKVEKIGVDKAKKNAAIADLNILIIDASKDIDEQDYKIMQLCDKNRTIVVLNKIDLGIKVNKNKISTLFDNIVEMSALNAQGEKEFRKMIEKVVGLSDADPCDVLISNERQFSSINKCLKTVNDALLDLKNGVTLDAITVLIQSSVENLMQLTGENVNIETVNRVFSKFCVGK